MVGQQAVVSGLYGYRRLLLALSMAYLCTIPQTRKHSIGAGVWGRITVQGCIIWL